MKKYYCKKISGSVNSFEAFGLEQRSPKNYLVVTEGENISFLYSTGVLKAKAFKDGVTVSKIDEYVKIGGWLEINEGRAFRMLGIKASVPVYSFVELEAAFARIREADEPHVVVPKGAVRHFATYQDNNSPLLFRHCRFFHEDGSVQGNGGFSLGIVIDHDKNLLEVYPAICDYSDTFSKHTANKLIEYRHRVGDGFTVPYHNDVSLVQNVEFGMNEAVIISNSKIVKDLLKTLSKYRDF